MHGAIKLKMVYSIIAACKAFSLLYCRMIHKVFCFFFNTNTNDKAWQVRIQPLLWKAINVLSLILFFFVSNQGVFSSLCILIPFPCFRFPSPTLFNGWILFMSGCSTQRKYVTFLCYRNGRDCQLFERATFLCPDLNYSYCTFLPYARLYAKHVTYYRIEFYQQCDEVVELSFFLPVEKLKPVKLNKCDKVYKPCDQSCMSLCDPLDYNLQGPFLHGIS